MEYKELLTWLAAFFTNWNEEYAPTGQVNQLQINVVASQIRYVFNGQVLCVISIHPNPAFLEKLSADPSAAQQQLLTNLLTTTRKLIASPPQKMSVSHAERQEVLVLLLRLYRNLEDAVCGHFPRVVEQLKLDPQEELLTQPGLLRAELKRRLRGDELPIARIERRLNYVDSLSATELGALFKAAMVMTRQQDWDNNAVVAAGLIRQLIK